MQALKKAERAKQNSLADDELDKPSEAFDELLALTPEPAPSTTPAGARVAAAPRAPAEFSLEPMDGLSLEPLAPPVAAASTEPRPSPNPLPSTSDHKAPGLTMDLALDPVAAPALGTKTASSDAASSTAGSARLAGETTPDQRAASATRAAAAGAAIGAAAVAGSTFGAAEGAAAGAGVAASAAAGTSAGTHGGSPAAASAGAGTSAGARGDSSAGAVAGAGAGTAAGARSGAPTPAAFTAGASAAHASAQSSAGGKSGGPSAGGGSAKPAAGAAARARARTAATAEPTGLDPERLRLIGLIALLVLLVGGFGIYYWRALTAPGAGAGLPPVPMPPAGATGAVSGPGQIVIANGVATDPAAAGAADAALGAPGASDADLMAPSAGSSRSQQELERRIAKTEQELATAQQAIQAAASPRAEQMPVLAAPANNDIRVTRIVQPAPVSPTLDSAYQAFNNGDTAGAQQQYDVALAQDANNRDALLGAAHVAARQNQKDKAAAYYLRLLELSPNDADATAGLIGLRQGDISQSEARLKAILANKPDAGPVLFALGNLYAQQGRWADAQQAYFRAVGSAPDNPDYQYNLAIGLDRLNQGKLALGYYQRALALAQDKAVGFDRNALRKRMHELTIAPH
jgi:tetratricopeptide (TPR) repeat protein